jgi:hypothetical protein
VLLYGIDIKVAGSLSLVVSLPTMLVAFARYSRHQAFTVLRSSGRFVLAMTAGSIAGTLVGALLLAVSLAPRPLSGVERHQAPASIDSGAGAPTTVKSSPGLGLGDPGCRHAWSAFGSCKVTVPAAPSTVTS